MYHCPYCPYSVNDNKRLRRHVNQMHLRNEDDIYDVDHESDEIEEAQELNQGYVVESVNSESTTAVASSFLAKQRLLFDLMELHRLWRVPRWQLSRLLDLAESMQRIGYFPKYSDVSLFETKFKNSGLCLIPEFMTVDSQSIPHIKTFKIGFIRLESHIRRAYKIPEVSRRLQQWPELQSRNGLIYDLYDLPSFRCNSLINASSRNLLLLFYVDKVTRNRQVNVAWKNVWVLRCIPVQMRCIDRADTNNWWDLMFIPGFLLKEKGVNFFLRRYTEELQQLRQNGVTVRDEYHGEEFKCRADYFGIIGDLPALSNTICFKEGGYSKLKRWCMKCFGEHSNLFDESPREDPEAIAKLIDSLASQIPNSNMSAIRTYFGINSRTVFWDLPSFNLTSVFFDFFHSCLEGELKKLTGEIFARDTNEIKRALFSDQQLELIDEIVDNLPLRVNDERLINFTRRHLFMSGHQMFTWLRVAIPTLADFFPKSPCHCRTSIRTQVAEDLQRYFDLNKTHLYWDHYVGLREYCLFYLRATSHLPLNIDSLVQWRKNLQNIVRLHIHLYGKDFVTPKTHFEVAHVVEQMKFQGKPGLLHCFTPERDNKSIKDINLNSTNVFYHILQISEMRKATQLCLASSDDESIQAVGKGLIMAVTEEIHYLLRAAYITLGKQIPQPFDLIIEQFSGLQLTKFELDSKSFIKYLLRNNENIGRFVCCLLHQQRYWIYCRKYRSLNICHPTMKLPLFQPTEEYELVSPEMVLQTTLLLPDDLPAFVRSKQTVQNAEKNRAVFVQCTEFE